MKRTGLFCRRIQTCCARTWTAWKRKTKRIKARKLKPHSDGACWSDVPRHLPISPCGGKPANLPLLLIHDRAAFTAQHWVHECFRCAAIHQLRFRKPLRSPPVVLVQLSTVSFDLYISTFERRSWLCLRSNSGVFIQRLTKAPLDLIMRDWESRSNIKLVYCTNQTV